MADYILPFVCGIRCTIELLFDNSSKLLCMDF